MGGLGQSHDAQVIGLGIAGRRCRHIAQHDIGRPGQQLRENIGGIVVIKILGQHRGPGDGLDRCHVDADDDPAGAPGLRPFDGDLRPPPGRGAEIDNPHAGLQKVELIVDLQQLEGGT